VQPQIDSAEAFTAFLRQQRQQWGVVIKLANIQASD
jgi:tripartite-type tricarboxylate transporter receptor subunit TctC